MLTTAVPARVWPARQPTLVSGRRGSGPALAVLPIAIPVTILLVSSVAVPFAVTIPMAVAVAVPLAILVLVFVFVALAVPLATIAISVPTFAVAMPVAAVAVSLAIPFSLCVTDSAALATRGFAL